MMEGRNATRKPLRPYLEAEAARCAIEMFYELTGGTPRKEDWFRWYLCERHGGSPLVVPHLPPGQIAFWDGEDILIDASITVSLVAMALPEELAHRLSSAETARFERLNSSLRFAPMVGRADFQEMVGQRVAALFEAVRPDEQER